MTTTQTDPRADWARWRTEREQELATPHGWLSLTALEWLDPAPRRVPGLPGSWRVTPDGEAVELTAAAADGLRVGGRPVTGATRLEPVDGQAGVLVAVGERRVEVIRRTASFALRVRDPQAATRTGFAGVPTFPHDPRWVLSGRFTAFDPPRPLTVGAVVEGLSHFPTALGEVEFALAGATHRLLALAGRDGGLTLHFRDATSGRQTYPGGRVLRTGDPGPDGRVEIDFNRTVNLPCAFTAYATCPLPPAENRLGAAVAAGERSPA